MQWRGRLSCAYQSASTNTHAAALPCSRKMPLGGRKGEDLSSMSSSDHVAPGCLAAAVWARWVSWVCAGAEGAGTASQLLSPDVGRRLHGPPPPVHAGASATAQGSHANQSVHTFVTRNSYFPNFSKSQDVLRQESESERQPGACLNPVLLEPAPESISTESTRPQINPRSAGPHRPRQGPPAWAQRLLT